MSPADDDRALVETVERLRQQNERLAERVDDLESDLRDVTTKLETVAAENDQLRETTDRLREENDLLRTENEHLRDRLDDCEAATERLEALADAARKRAGANKDRVEELQARELEKGAHLRAHNVDRCELDLSTDRLERITKDDGRAYYRLPESADPLDRGGDVALAHGDLLPIQQLARMDEDMLRSTTNALPTRLAAQLWRARTDPQVGDDPWREGCEAKGVREYVKASDLKHWIRRQEPGTSEAYAKKLVSRTIDALLELSRNRVAVRKRTERKNGLRYTERRVLLPTDADVPGEGATETATATETETDPTTAPPETPDVHGED